MNPLPAIVVIVPDASTFRIRWFPVSQMSSAPDESTIIPSGHVSWPRVAGPPSPPNPPTPPTGRAPTPSPPAAPASPATRIPTPPPRRIHFVMARLPVLTVGLSGFYTIVPKNPGHDEYSGFSSWAALPIRLFQ